LTCCITCGWMGRVLVGYYKRARRPTVIFYKEWNLGTDLVQTCLSISLAVYYSSKELIALAVIQRFGFISLRFQSNSPSQPWIIQPAPSHIKLRSLKAKREQQRKRKKKLNYKEKNNGGKKRERKTLRRERREDEGKQISLRTNTSASKKWGVSLNL
jgi:hypothetical protein